jgi:hypothetical protein
MAHIAKPAWAVFFGEAGWDNIRVLLMEEGPSTKGVAF